MTPKKWTEMSFEAYYLGRVLAILPDNLPSIWEARIQNGKISRMLSKRIRSDKGIDAGLRALGGGSLRKLNKELGKRAQLAGQQARKVRALSYKVFKEFKHIDQPQLSNAKYRQWRKQFDSGMSAEARKFTQEVTKRVALKIGVASRQLTGHRK